MELDSSRYTAQALEDLDRHNALEHGLRQQGALYMPFFECAYTG